MQSRITLEHHWCDPKTKLKKKQREKNKIMGLLQTIQTIIKQKGNLANIFN